MTAAMQTSYDDLDPATGRAYRLLSLYPGPDSTTLLDTDAGLAADVTAALVNASLPLSGGNRYAPVQVP